LYFILQRTDIFLGKQERQGPAQNRLKAAKGSEQVQRKGYKRGKGKETENMIQAKKDLLSID